MNAIDELTSAVCRELQVRRTDLWTCNREECVDARTVLCTILGEWGLTDTDISRRFGLTRQGVNKLRNAFRMRYRTKWNVRQAYNGLCRSPEKTSN